MRRPAGKEFDCDQQEPSQSQSREPPQLFIGDDHAAWLVAPAASTLDSAPEWIRLHWRVDHWDALTHLLLLHVPPAARLQKVHSRQDS